MPYVFLSYSRRDAAQVDEVAKVLGRSGVQFWVDRNGISGGDQWRTEIVSAIQGAGLVLLFLSPSSARSENVRRELDLADQAKVRVLPLAISPTEIPDSMKFHLAGVQIVNLWQDRDEGLSRLLRALKSMSIGPANAPRGSRGRAVAPAQQAKVDLSKLGGAGMLDNFDWRRLFSWRR